jgi:hypothetical protein
MTQAYSKLTKTSYMFKAILFFLIPTAFALASVVNIVSDHKPEVTKLPAAYGRGTGYQEQPAQYDVVASSHYRWTHGTGSGLKVILGLIVFAAGAAFLMTDPKEGKGIAVLAFTWLLGFGIIFGKHVINYYGPTGYEKTITADQYEQNKDHLDIIFGL